jgi:N-acyl-D-aspartate/D-glutamate deacylase
MSFDLVVRGGTVVDGSGLPGFRADVGVVGGRIARIGRIGERGRQEVDAEGHVVTPGFIDGHTHMDAQVMWDPWGTCSSWHGITTVLMGNCGFTLAPARPDARELVVRNLERAEDIPREAMAAGIDWTWETFPEYLDAVEGVPKAINYGASIGHSAMRTWTMGERAFEEPASEDDLALMERTLREALQAGAMGFTTSRTNLHLTSDDRPVASRLATWDEVCRLVGVLSDLGVGFFQLAPGPGGAGDPPDGAAFLQRLAELAIQSRVPVAMGLSPIRPRCYDQMDLMDRSAQAGARMFGLTHSRGIAIVLSFRTHMPFDKLPEWKAVRSLPLPEQRRALEDPDTRQRLVHAAHNGPYGGPMGAEVREPDYRLMRVLHSPIPPNPTVAEEAEQRGMDPVELIIDLALKSDFEQFFVQPLFYEDPADAETVLKHPRTTMTFSDSGAHLTTIMDASIQTHLLAHWVRNRQVFTLEEAVRMLTFAPSRLWDLPDRGLIREGLAADINVFDPDRVGPEMPTVENDLPAGASRLVQRSEGFLATIVNGQVTLRDSQPTGATPGQLLRGALARGAAPAS